MLSIQCCTKTEPDLDGYGLANGVQDVETILQSQPPATVLSNAATLLATSFSLTVQFFEVIIWIWGGNSQAGEREVQVSVKLSQRCKLGRILNSDLRA